LRPGRQGEDDRRGELDPLAGQFGRGAGATRQHAARDKADRLTPGETYLQEEGAPHRGRRPRSFAGVVADRTAKAVIMIRLKNDGARRSPERAGLSVGNSLNPPILGYFVGKRLGMIDSAGEKVLNYRGFPDRIPWLRFREFAPLLREETGHL
jgi:hypothetical protein